MNKMHFLLMVVLLPCIQSTAQTIVFENAIAGNNPGADNPFTNGQLTTPHVAASGIGRGGGIIAATATNDRYNARNWDAPVFDTAKYFEFTLVADTGYDIDFISFTYSGQASGTGPDHFSFRSSRDSFATDIGPATAAGNTILLPAFQNITSITFRLYGWGASGSTGTYSINDFQFNAATPLPLNHYDFTVERSGTSNYLNWQLADAQYIQNVSVMNSRDGKNFLQLASISVADSNTVRQSFRHPAPAAGKNYYRLAVTAIDGSITYSRVISIVSEQNGGWHLHPNPAADWLYINTPDSPPTEKIQITDACGRILINHIDQTSNIGPVDVRSLPDGIYFIRLQSAGAAISRKFRVKH